MFKIIERKHFKQPQEVNLLTWDAKEQIRYLHLEFPDEWTVERLSESFPISKEGVIKLLRSKFVPESIEQIIKHDKRVQQQWLQLKAGGHQGGPITQRYKQLQAEGKLQTLHNAAGIPTLPAPKSHQLFLPVEKPKSGSFYNIVKDYCEKKQQLQEKQTATTHAENTKLLADVTKAIHVAKPKPQLLSFKYADKNIDELNEKSDDSRCLLDKSWNQHELSSSSRNELLQQSRAAEMADLQLSGTGNLTPKEKAPAYNRDIVEMYNIHTREPADASTREAERKKQEILEKMKYEDMGSEKMEAYVFDSKHGYQHPLGRQMDQPEKLTLRKSKLKSQKKSTMYKRGNAFYDETGDFIFRIPGMPES